MLEGALFSIDQRLDCVPDFPISFGIVFARFHDLLKSFRRDLRDKLCITEAFVVAAVIALAGCDGKDYRNSQQIERDNQERSLKQMAQSIGMPAITNFAEKRMMKDIIELRDQNVATTTYLVGMNNQLTKLCDSVGYGLPYATQFTNPQKRADWGSITIAQADPNGLYSPASAEGTWVLCVDHKSGKPKPLYIEPRIIVSPIPLQ